MDAAAAAAPPAPAAATRAAVSSKMKVMMEKIKDSGNPICGVYVWIYVLQYQYIGIYV